MNMRDEGRKKVGTWSKNVNKFASQKLSTRFVAQNVGVSKKIIFNS